MTDEAHQLRRRLRAMSAVNSQLRGQLEDTSRNIPEAAARRAQTARNWQFEPERVPFDSLSIIEGPTGASYLVEAGHRRRIKAGLLMPGLERLVGPHRAVSEKAIDRLPEGPPLEVLEAPSGPPFLVLAGQRVPLRGLPVPHPVSLDAVAGFPQGPELNVKPTLSNRAIVSLVRVRIAQRGGLVATTRTLARRARAEVRNRR